MTLVIHSCYTLLKKEGEERGSKKPHFKNFVSTCKRVFFLLSLQIIIPITLWLHCPQSIQFPSSFLDKKSLADRPNTVPSLVIVIMRDHRQTLYIE